MKKLIVFSMVLALVAGSAFAVDVTGTVFGHVNVLEGSNAEGSDTTASGGMDRVRIDGSGESDDGTFGGYIRYQGAPVGVDSVNAWWKPIDQFKLIIGNNSDGFWGKEGVTGWGFNQMPYDSSVAFNPGTWFGNYWNSSPYEGGAFMCSRYTFFEGVVGEAALLEITPTDMISINIAIPFMAHSDYHAKSGKAEDVFKAATAQLSVNLDFGNIAVTYAGAGRSVTGALGGDELGDGAIFLYFGGNFGDLGLDVGFSYRMRDGDNPDYKYPMGLGVGVKYGADSWGIKFKTTAALNGDEKGTYINAAVLPYFTINDSMSAFINAGLGYTKIDKADAVIGWYLNPYLRVGAEWGPTFYAGLQIFSDGTENPDKVVNWAVPISLMVSF